MAIKSLTEVEIATWSRQQKDEWWLKNVYRGNMPQLTIRAGVTGFLLGVVLSATALYIGAKTGIGIGVGLTSVIMAFAIFRILASLNIANDFTILENNATQSIATAAGYMMMPLISSLAAYMMVTGKVVPAWNMIAWMTVCSIFGVLLAFPMKRRFINEDQAPFPEGRAVGVVLDSLYTGSAAEGIYKAKLLGYTALITAIWQALTSNGWMKLVQFKMLMMDKWAGLKAPWFIHESLDVYYYNFAAKAGAWIPTIGGVDIRQLGLRFTLDAAMLGIGGLIGIGIASSILLGSFINFVVLAPIMINLGDIAPRVMDSGKIVPISRAEIVNQWSLWWGVTMMVVGSMITLFAKPELFTGIFKGWGKKDNSDAKDVLKDIEVPLWISYVGVPIAGLAVVAVSHYIFSVPWALSFLALPLIIIMTVICTNSVALTAWAPTGATSKITQFAMGALDRTNPASNLIPAGITAEVASNSAHLLSDIKPGYMLGAKPRHQAIGHVIGIFAGALASVPLFYLLFLPADADGMRSTSTMVSDAFSFPAAIQWKGVAEIIAKGVSTLPTSALISMALAAVAAAVFEILRIKTKGRFPISAVSVGLGVVLPPAASLMMWIGAMIFWWMGGRKNARNATPGSKGHRFWVEGCEPICAGLICGAALMGIGNAIINVLI
jgi:uncharacterized oligopeptide transporter (OPT) family protein